MISFFFAVQLKDFNAVIQILKQSSWKTRSSTAEMIVKTQNLLDNFQH